MQLRLLGRLSMIRAGSTSLTCSRNREGLNDWIYEQAHPNEDNIKSEP